MNHYSSDELTKYLTGGSTEVEAQEIYNHLNVCPECSKLLDEEVNLEISIIDASHNSNKSIVSQCKIDELVKKAITETENPEQPFEPKTKPTNIVSFKYIWAAAAIFILALVVNFVYKKNNIITQTVASVKLIPATNKANNIHDIPNKKLKQIGNKTFAVASKSAKLKVLSSTENNATLSLDSGSALFSVEPHRYNSFVVNTPDAEIRVTGTIFDVFVNNGQTKVTVVEGNVIVNYLAKNKVVTLKKEQFSEEISGNVIVKKATSQDLIELLKYQELLPKEAEHKSVLAPLSLSPIIEPIQSINSANVINWNDKITEAATFSDNKQYDKALSLYNEIVTANLGNRTEEIARFERAVILIKNLDKAKDGVQSLEEYLKIFPKGAFEEEALLEILKSSKNSPSNIYNNTIRFISKYADHPYARRAAYENATLLREAASYVDAAKLYGKFTELWPRDNRSEDAMYWKGQALSASGDSFLAQQTFSKYVEKYPQGRWVREAKAALTN